MAWVADRDLLGSFKNLSIELVKLLGDVSKFQ